MEQEKADNPKEKTLDISDLNKHFEDGGSILDVVNELQSIDKPIVVDFNGVLANNLPGDSLEPNPNAVGPMQILKEAGTVVVVTQASGWNEVQGVLESGNLWEDDMVLITRENYEMTNDMYLKDPKLKKVINDYVEQHNESDPEQPITELSVVGGHSDKRFAPYFNKEYLVPIIDDASNATDGNPGMLGLNVKKWESKSASVKKLPGAKSGITLEEAADKVKEHYSNI